MRKNHILTDTVREIRKTRSRFLSILILSMLAVAFLAGLRTTRPDMERSADAYFDAQRLMDLVIYSTLGLTDDDIRVLSAQPGIAAAEGAWTVDAIARLSQNDRIVKVHSLSEQGLNAPRLVEGRMPENSGECLAEPLFLTENNLRLGDSITLDTGSDSFENALHGTVFTIVGTADSPLYPDVERGSSSLGTGKVSAFLILPRSAFAMEEYTEAYLMAEGAEGLICYSDAYEALIDGRIDALKVLGETRAGLRYDEVVTEGRTKVDDAQKEFDEAEAEANQELGDAKKELDDARKKLDDGWREYADGTDTLTRETADAEQKLADALTDLTQGELDYTDGQQELADGWVEYEDGTQELADGQKDYDDAFPELWNGEQEYNEALAKLQDGEAEYADGLRQYNDGMEELAASSKKLTQAKKDLDNAADSLFAGGEQVSSGRSAYNTQVAQLNALLTPVLASSGYSGTTGDELVARMNDSDVQAADWAVITGTRDGLKALVEAGLADAGQQALYGGLYAVFADASDLSAYTGLAAILADSSAQLESAADSISFGWLEYESGMEQYQRGVKELMDGSAKLQDSYVELSDARRELDGGWAELRGGRRELDDGWAELDEARQKLVDGQQELDEAYAELQSGGQELADARKELDDGWIAYADGKQELAEKTADAKRELADAYQELTDGETEYADGLAEYEDGKAEAEAKLSDARQELSDARRKVSEIESCKWYVLGRGASIGYASFESNAERMGNLASVFPLIFFLVAALVCLTTMTRMVEEQRVEIGGLKALGFRRRDIAVKYVGYGLLSSAAGGVLGLALGCTVIPLTIYTAWGTLYTLGKLVIPFYPGISVLSVLAAVATVTLSALWACFSALTAVPAQLMRPKAPPSGKRVLLERLGPVWKRLSFIHKVTVRNLFRYKKRFWMTVIGIAGCTALLIAGFGLRDSIFDVLNLQYDKLTLFSSQIGLKDNVTPEELIEIARVLDDGGLVSAWALCAQETLTVESDSGRVEASLLTAADDARLEDYIVMDHRTDETPVTLGGGAVLTEKLAKLLGVTVGDTVVLDGDARVSVTVSDITENYIQHYIYLTPAYYREVYGKAPEGNLILARYADGSGETADKVSSALISLSGVSSVSRSTDTREIYTHSMQSVNYAVIIVTVSAAALAFVVLYNLTNINITERRRELATLKVLGFYNRELSSYVFRENFLLTLFGIGLGLLFGKYLHQWLVLTVEIDMLMFGRTVHPFSYGCAAALTVLFSVLVNLAARRKLGAIDMVESLKTVE